MTQRHLSGPEAKSFYDRFGSKQDRQGWYEDRAIGRLVGAARFDDATSVVELGCGTGRVAEMLLADHLPESASYRGFDISETMVDLSRQRLSRFGERASVELLDVDGGLPEIGAGSVDRLVSTYVLDLLPDAEIELTLDWAARILELDGRLCVAGITAGCGLLSRLVMGSWNLVAKLRAETVGGCRPVSVGPRLGPTDWEIELCEVVVQWGIASEVVVARRRG